MKIFSFLLSLVLAQFAYTDHSQASVSLKNGNFFMGYSDLTYPGGFEPKIERVYNSKTPYNGVFGWGWGNEYEVNLKVSADGSLVVNEYGGGAQNRFVPDNMNTKELESAVAIITDAAKKSGILGSAEAVKNYQSKLMNDAMFRNDEWQKFLAQGKVKARQIPDGASLKSVKFAYQVITKTKEGYVRKADSGRTEVYDLSGKLIKVTDNNGHFAQFTYNKSNQLERITDNYNRKIYFTYNKLGKVDKIQGENNKTAEYKYNDQGELIYVKDTDGLVYTYKYSADRRHNLTEIGYSDKTNLQVTYYGRDKFENVKSVKDKDGSLTEYVYDKIPNEANSHRVAVTIKDEKNKVASKSVYSYVYKSKKDGEEYTYKMISDIDGSKTETIYNECCGLPINIKRGAEETSFVYDDKGRVLKKTTPFEITDITYDQKASKVSRVNRVNRKNAKDKSWFIFEYDAKANLSYAKSSDNKAVRLFYDNAGRIASMVDQSKKRIDFKYNDQSKPILITDPSKGSLKVTYNNSGEVTKVDSEGGRSVASEITASFQALLELIKPAGVTLSF